VRSGAAKKQQNGERTRDNSSRRVGAARFRANRGGGMARHAFSILVRRQLGRGCGEFKINGFGRADKRRARDAEIFDESPIHRL
jgi:hypothetical protein